ncbi:hypothetical protein D0469_15860 [Peribacillus saganii]|uniref:Group-specific protein n=1 Tax=Peribacillus saganii TaxID=2303992 RepID=A0A372LLH0_9BACI|nr:hypothetical protein [Peribacillus saganii]RFU67096.1 hypothetical protein D0469_15860 [Peribacillus saganii]
MFKDLSSGVKISITRSISTVFEHYMAKIDWEESRFSMEAFVVEWQEYITKHASWYNKVDNDIKGNPLFHEEMASKINETINKILSEEPTQEQMDDIKALEAKLGKEIPFSCRAEARYVIEKANQS